jgi:hypothetical protein
MQKIKFLLGLLSVFTSFFTLNSCKKSYNCCYTYTGTTTKNCTEVTKPSGMSYSAFKSYIKTIEAQGETCN